MLIKECLNYTFFKRCVKEDPDLVEYVTNMHFMHLKKMFIKRNFSLTKRNLQSCYTAIGLKYGSLKENKVLEGSCIKTLLEHYRTRNL